MLLHEEFMKSPMKITKHEWRFVMGWPDWLAVVLQAITIVLLVYAFAGCAQREKPAPIEAYRQQAAFHNSRAMLRPGPPAPYPRYFAQ